MVMAAGSLASPSFSRLSNPVVELSPTLTAKPSVIADKPPGERRPAVVEHLADVEIREPNFVVVERLRRPCRATVLVVGVELTGLGEPLLDVPATARVETRVECQSVLRRARLHDRLTVGSQVVERHRGLLRVEARGLEHALVVVEHRVGDVERHRPLHALGRIGGETRR